jgi:hypothetical protein
VVIVRNAYKDFAGIETPARLALRTSPRHPDSGSPQLRGRQAFRTARPREPMRAFSLLKVEGEQETGQTVDPVALAEKARHE